MAATKLSATANAVSATKLATARTLTVGGTGKDFDGTANLSWSLSEIGAARSAGEVSSGAAANIDTATFVQWLKSIGAFNDRSWTARCSWYYAGNRTITDTGCGNIHLAGCTIEVISTSESHYTIRVITPTTTSYGGTTGAEFVYVDNGPEYLPGWRRIYTTSNKPTPGDVGAVNKAGDTMTGNLTAPKVLVSGAQGTEVNALTRKDYVDSAIAAGDALQVSKSGDTMSGNLTAPAVLVSSAQNTSVNALTRKDYVDSAIAAGDALQVSKTGDTMTGGLTFVNADCELGWSFNTDYAKIGFKNTADGDTDSYMWFKTGDNGNEYFKWQGVSGANTTDWMSLKSTGLVVAAGVTAPTFTGALAGNAATATKLATARQINGTNFDGTANITTANWGTARTLTIGNSGKSVNGAGNVSWSLAEIGAVPQARTINAKPLTSDIVLSAADVGAVAASDDSYWRYRGGTTNLNDAALARPGYFSFVPGATGIPLAGIYGHGFSIGNGGAAGSGNWYSQIAFGHNGRIYTRNGINSAATGGWDYFFTSNDKPTPTDIGLSVLSQNTNGLRISLNGKYLDIGARNTAWTHLQTDATSGVYFYNNIAAVDVQITSDERLKSEFEPIVGALDKVRSLSGLTYTKRAVEGDATKREAGLIAQAVQRVLPEAVGVGADDFLTLSPAGVIALLVEAIKELEAKVNDCTR